MTEQHWCSKRSISERVDEIEHDMPAQGVPMGDKNHDMVRMGDALGKNVGRVERESSLDISRVERVDSGLTLVSDEEERARWKGEDGVED